MALFGGARDISLFRHLSRELMADIITQQCSFYKFKLEETKVNIYGEAAEEKFYMGPVLVNCLIERSDETYPETDLGTDFTWGATFKNPDYPNSPQIQNPGLDEFGSSISIIVETHYVPADKVGITQERLYTGNNNNPSLNG